MKQKVQVVIFCLKTQEVLLLQTNERRGQFWQNVTGSVEKGESFEQAALRELQEETGIQTASLQSLPYEIRYKTQKKGHDVLEKTFLACLQQRPSIILDPGEHSQYQWRAFNAILASSYFYHCNYEAFLYAQKTLS